MTAPEPRSHDGQPPADDGDGLVVPGPLHQHERRWSRIHEVLTADGVTRYRVRWLGNERDSVVVPSPGHRIESAVRRPHPGGDAVIGVRPW